LRTLSAPTLAALASGSVAIVQMVHLAFSSPIALNLSNWNLTYGGVTYLAANGLGTISTLTDKPGEVQGITFELFADASYIALALDAADEVQGTVCTIRTAIIETTNYTVLDAPVEWLGRLDKMAIVEDGNQAGVQVSAESKAVDLMSGNPMFYSDADQRTVNAYDGSFKFVVSQSDKPVVWPAKEFFYQ